ncbi:hypothetical protein KL930_003539 [Ogataea haglerorum]|uniref:Uncharacterized protein n=1 Tax=Ogataea haglerorum TaxID=1937702 RepID=A0AAN6I161_9ASCO|nr:uncharacterized protein KL911_003131 [Ogataea haglerorum]KAG7695871.1 hypothetical protein KL951_003396 [Ogataea haglerorum]KAG7705705.1 hypothetical protein KL914_003543 [Ogataea haglerorum]KAG7707277.1 hypothetical protein KL950_002937 [Ogataea haglerorum]KAG7718426.1 hypothetical protein KL913_002421 [Ogataea haglerorum]KAG7718725.1 hypothetical protein KL949_002721 [Ogataea haglerorum]
MDSVYEEFSRYDFDSNEEYLAGLKQVMEQYLILQSQSDPEISKDISEGVFDVSKIKPQDKEQLVWQAKVYFFCSQTGEILDLDDYRKWESTRKLQEPQGRNTKEIPYSSNYEQLVDLIVNNKPIPGIKQIPDTVLGPELSSSSMLSERKKPWEQQKERDCSEQKDAPGDGTQIGPE